MKLYLEIILSRVLGTTSGSKNIYKINHKETTTDRTDPCSLLAFWAGGHREANTIRRAPAGAWRVRYKPYKP